MKTIANVKMLAASVAMAGLFSASANAVTLFGSDMYLDLGTNGYDSATTVGNEDANSQTGIFTEMTFGQFLATSVYDITDGSLLGSFYDTNDPVTLAALGIPTSGLALDGVTTVTLNLPADPGGIDIDGLQPNVFLPLSGDNEGFGGSWELVAKYTLNGTLGATSPTYTSGTIDLIFRELLDGNASGGALETFTVLTLSLTGSNVQLTNLQLDFDVTYAKPGFLWVKNAGGTFVDASTVETLAQLDTNVNPVFPTTNQLLPINTGGTAAPDVAVRQTTLDGSISYKVPEPATLGLFGLGLLGLGSVRRRAARS